MSVDEKNISREEVLNLTMKVEIGIYNIAIIKGPYTVGAASFYFRVENYFDINNNLCLISLRFNNKVYNSEGNESYRVVSQAMNIKNFPFKNDNTWHLVYNKEHPYCNFDVDICVHVVKPTLNPFSGLYDDENLTDFQLRAEDGCVSFHKVVLAVSSPVLKTMLSGEWKETQQGHVDVPGVSKDTIQQFKDYVYKCIVPEKVSFELMSLASYYMMPELEEICMRNIADNLTSENAWSQIEKCVLLKSKKLFLTILNHFRCMQDKESSDFFKWLENN